MSIKDALSSVWTTLSHTPITSIKNKFLKSPPIFTSIPTKTTPITYPPTSQNNVFLPNTLQLLPPLHPSRLSLRHPPSRLRHSSFDARNQKPDLNRNASHKPRSLQKQTPSRDLESLGTSSWSTSEQHGSLSAICCGDGMCYPDSYL